MSLKKAFYQCFPRWRQHSVRICEKFLLRRLRATLGLRPVAAAGNGDHVALRRTAERQGRHIEGMPRGASPSAACQGGEYEKKGLPALRLGSLRGFAGRRGFARPGCRRRQDDCPEKARGRQAPRAVPCRARNESRHWSKRRGPRRPGRASLGGLGCQPGQWQARCAYGHEPPGVHGLCRARRRRLGIPPRKPEGLSTALA